MTHEPNGAGCSLHDVERGVRIPATHKVGEEFAAGDPLAYGHNYTNYLCCECFGRVMGEVAKAECKIHD